MAMAMCAESHPTRQRYDELRRRYRKQLLRSVSPTKLLLSALSEIETFAEKVSDVTSVMITEEKAEKILSLPLDDNYDETIVRFLSVLRDNGHAHVADVFTTGSNKDLLTEDYYQLLCKKLDVLRDYLDPECGILASLVSKGVFTMSEKEMVYSRETANDKVEQIIEILSRKTNRSYQHFIVMLKDNDQEHIVNILTEGREGSPPISREDLKLIRVQRKSVLKSMESKHTSFVSTLLSLEVFTDGDRQRVEAVEVHHKRNEQILNILVRKSRRHFDQFIKALNETSQEHVATLFQALTISGAVNAKSSRGSLSKFAEVKLKSAFTKDFEDEGSLINRELESRGIHAAGVDSGSIKIWFKFVTKETLDDIRCNKLDRLFTERYCKLFSHEGVESLDIQIAEKEFERCREQIDKRKALMKPKRRMALKLAAKEIAHEMTVDENLLKGLSLCEHRQEAVLNPTGNRKKAEVLLKVMARRPDCEFQQLEHALRRTGQDTAADFIIGKNANVASSKLRE